MYSLQDALTAIRYPGLVGTELNKLYHRSLGDPRYNEEGIDVFTEDWDVLVILDACRYDMFAEVVGDDLGTRPLESRISRGSATKEWVEANFTDRTLHDLVYVDSNAHYGRLKSGIDSDVFKYQLVENDEYGGTSVHPDKVTSAAVAAAEEYPHKRLLVHYMQPHHPFFGPSADRIEHKDSYLKTVKENGLDRESVRQLYRENLEIVLESVRQLVEEVEGRIVISSDHGEMLGDREAPIPVVRYYHPARVHVPELVKVPWLVHDNDSRRRIYESNPESDEIGVDNDEIDQKLRDLGYST